MNSNTLELHPDRAARAVIPTLRRVVVPTDVSGEGMARARRAATMLAVEHGWELVLYDRSDERWTDTPHASGLLPIADISGRDHLVRQMSEIEAKGVKVTAWLATVPALSAMIDVLQEVEIDGVMVPDELERPRLADRLQAGGDPADMVERIAGLQLGGNRPEFLVVDESGRITLVENSVTAASAGPR